MQLVGSSCARRLRREALHIILDRRVQPSTKPTEAQVEEEKGALPFRPAPTVAAEVWRTRRWPFTPRTEPAIFFGGPVAEEMSNLCYMFGMANDEKPVEKALMALSSVAITLQDIVTSNLVIIIANSGMLGRYFDDAIIRDLKHRLQDCVHLATPPNILAAGGSLLDGTAEGVLQDFVTDDYGNQTLVRVDIVVVHGIVHNPVSVITEATKCIVTIFEYENPRRKGIEIYSFVLDFSADGYGAKELAMNAVTNAQV